MEARSDNAANDHAMRRGVEIGGGTIILFFATIAWIAWLALGQSCP